MSMFFLLIMSSKEALVLFCDFFKQQQLSLSSHSLQPLDDPLRLHDPKHLLVQARANTSHLNRDDRIRAKALLLKRSHGPPLSRRLPQQFIVCVGLIVIISTHTIPRARLRHHLHTHGRPLYSHG